MKAEHRKELETNVLADQMGRVLHRMKEGPNRKTVFVGSAIVLLVVLFFVWSFFKSSADDANSALWEGWYALSTPAELDTFATDHQASMPGRLARFQTARLDFSEGLAEFGAPLQRNQALAKLRRAADTYEKLINESGTPPLLQQEAMLNAAKAYESLEEAEKAKTSYQKLAKAFPNTVAGKEAENCLKRLEAGTKDLEILKKLAQETGRPAN